MASPSPRMGAGSSASSQPDEVVAASLDEPHSKTGHGETAVIRKAPVKVIWAAATHDAVLDIRYDAARSEAWLALRFPNIVLREQGNVSFFVAFAPEDIESLTFLEEGAAYHMVVQLRQPPGIVGPDCTWTDPELFGPGTLTVQQLQTLGLETSCTLSVPAKEAKKTQLKLFCETISKGSTRSLKRYYNAASLYRGKGGRRFGATEAWCPPSYAQVGAGGGNSVSASAKATSAEALPTYGAIVTTESIQGREQATMRPPKRPRRSMSTEDPPEHPPCPMCEDVKATMNKKMDDIMSQLAQLTEVNRRLNERVEESASTVASLNERINGLETLVATHTQEHEAEVSEKLQDEVLAIMRDEFVEKEDLEYTVATEVDIEIDTASKYIEEKLKEELLEYVNEEMEGKEDEIIETILDRIGSARVRLDF